MVVKAKLNHHNWQLSWVTTQRQVISHKANENGPLKSAHVCQQLWVPGAICLEMCTLHRRPPANKATLSRTGKGKRTRLSSWRVHKAPFASWWFAASLAPAFISQSPRKMQSSQLQRMSDTHFPTEPPWVLGLTKKGCNAEEGHGLGAGPDFGGGGSWDFLKRCLKNTKGF